MEIKPDFEQAYIDLLRAAAPEHAKWHHAIPMIITHARMEEFRRLQQLLDRAIRHFVEQYDNYTSLMPVSSRVEHILELASARPYKIGTHRPDFIVDEAKQIRICEINSRFPDGFFLAGFSEYISQKMAQEKGVPIAETDFSAIGACLWSHFGSIERVCALKSADRPGDIRFYIPTFESMRIPCRVIPPDQFTVSLPLLQGAAVIDEFNQADLVAMGEMEIQALASANTLNDLRTKFLVHDKRFLGVLSTETWLARIFTDQEIEFLLKHIIPTYSRTHRPDLWQAARIHKDDWIIKHSLLGKGEKVYAGCDTPAQEWQDIFESSMIDQMVLQPFIKQHLFSYPSEGGGDEYLTGSFRCFDDVFLGPGLFRSSEAPVMRVGMNRKLALFCTDQVEIPGGAIVL